MALSIQAAIDPLLVLHCGGFRESKQADLTTAAYVFVRYMQGEYSVSGGDASTLDGPIYLCSRADRDPLLFFTGQLAQLQVGFTRAA